jgi:hypothetical protein
MPSINATMEEVPCTPPKAKRTRASPESGVDPTAPMLVSTGGSNKVKRKRLVRIRDLPSEAAAASSSTAAAAAAAAPAPAQEEAKSDSEVDGEGDAEYEVDRVLDHRLAVDGHSEKYLVRWVGFDSPHDNTWLPREEIEHTQALRDYLLRVKKQQLKELPRESFLDTEAMEVGGEDDEEDRPKKKAKKITSGEISDGQWHA